jgi:hypothetical protein
MVQKRFPFSQTFGIDPSWPRARSSNGETALSVILAKAEEVGNSVKVDMEG